MSKSCNMRYAIDLPNPFDLDGPLLNIDYFETKKEALKYAKDLFNADSKGRINIISKLPQED
jgi:hypothetical protein